MVEHYKDDEKVVESKLDSKLPDHIEEYLLNKGGSSPFIELFESKPDDFDLKTELNKQEIVISNIIMLNSDFMKNKQVPDEFNIFDSFIKEYLRLRVSLDRKSRAEFVNINKKDNFKDNLETVGSFNNLKELKQ